MQTKQTKKWSKKVTIESGALNLPEGIFTSNKPKKIAFELKFAADHSKKRKSGAYQSAMSMLCFYINRAGKKLDPSQKKILEEAKQELRKLYKN